MNMKLRIAVVLSVFALAACFTPPVSVAKDVGSNVRNKQITVEGSHVTVVPFSATEVVMHDCLVLSGVTEHSGNYAVVPGRVLIENTSTVVIGGRTNRRWVSYKMPVYKCYYQCLQTVHIDPGLRGC